MSGFERARGRRQLRAGRSPRVRRLTAKIAIAGAVALAPATIRAEAGGGVEGTTPGTRAPVLGSADEPNPEKSRERLRKLTEPRGYFDFASTLMIGDGLRFNNPYRLAHQLGERGESLSLTAPYVDVAIVVATGRPTGILHGGRLGWSVAMSGVPQGAVTPAYLAALRPNGHWLFYGWLGIPFLTAPDLNAGAELALAGTYFVRAGIGATAALVADAFYGAGTRETRAAFYPVLSAQLGICINYEVLP